MDVIVAQIPDAERMANQLTSLNGKGYARAVVVRDVLDRLVVKSESRVRPEQGERLLYVGRLDDINELQREHERERDRCLASRPIIPRWR